MNETPTAPVQSDEQQFRAEVAAINSPTWATGESELDRAAKIEAAYKRREGQTAPGRPIEAPAPAPGAQQGEPALVPVEAYVPMPEGVARPMPALPGNLQWDARGVEDIYRLTASGGLRSTDAAALFGVIAECAKDSRKWTRDELRVELTRRHGAARAQDMVEFYGEVPWKVVASPKWRRDLTSSGIVNHPSWVEFIAGLGEKMLDSRTPHGERRLKNIYGKKNGWKVEDAEPWPEANGEAGDR